MKRREGGRRDRADGFPPQPFSGDDAFRTAHLHRLRILEPPPNERTCQIHHLVVVSFFADWRGHWLGHVSILALRERYSCDWISTFPDPKRLRELCLLCPLCFAPLEPRGRGRQAGPLLGGTKKQRLQANRVSSGASQGHRGVSQ